MMTFRPYASHQRSASVLDNKRLGKQRLEALQIMSAAMSWYTGEHGGAVGWSHHPVVKMWAGQENPYLDHACGGVHLLDLTDYFYAISAEWQARGFAHNIDHKMLPFRLAAYNDGYFADHALPWGPAQEKAHKLILLRKDPDWYGQYWRKKLRTPSSTASTVE